MTLYSIHIQISSSNSETLMLQRNIMLMLNGLRVSGAWHRGTGVQYPVLLVILEQRKSQKMGSSATACHSTRCRSHMLSFDAPNVAFCQPVFERMRVRMKGHTFLTDLSLLYSADGELHLAGRDTEMTQRCHVSFQQQVSDQFGNQDTIVI